MKLKPNIFYEAILAMDDKPQKDGSYVTQTDKGVIKISHFSISINSFIGESFHGDKYILDPQPVIWLRERTKNG